jgi:NADH-quinone oxidoreductase subunit C
MLKNTVNSLEIIQKHNFNKDIFKIYKFINLKLVFIFLQIFKNIQIKIYGIDLKIILKKKNLLNYLQVLKKTSNFLFKVLVDLVVEDFPKKKKRFYVKYILRSLEFGKSLHLTIKTKEFKPIFSIINLYKSAFWLEREAWDMYGIFFLNNKDLRRLLTDYGFRGNPFKKDFPLIGYVELYFDFFLKKLKYKKVTNTQKKQEFYSNKTFFKKKK